LDGAGGAAGGVAGEKAVVTSEGAANLATGPKLADDLAIAQAKDPRIGTTLPGANAPITVTAESNIGGRALFDTNQTARPSVLADPNKPTLISDLIPPGKPNSTMANAHAEVGLIQQAYDAGLTQGQNMTIVVRGEVVCTYCQQSTNLVAAADRAGLNSLEVVDTKAGITYVWTKGSNGLVEK
jgi:filamentous hemagglutinin